MSGQESILGRTMRGAGWVVAWRMLTRLLGLASTLVLVRLLAPDDFGLVALAAAFATTLDVCLSLGVEDQIVRARDPRPALYNTAFTLNLLRGLFVAVAVAIAAAPAARFFGDMRLEDVLLAIAVSAAATGLTNVGVVDFRRHLMFHKEFWLQLLPRLLGIAVTIGGAAILRNHWALVLGILVNRFGVVIMSYMLHPYRPRLDLSAWRELAGVSFWSWAISTTAVVRDRMDSFVIGRTMAPVQVGVFTVGVEVATLPTTEVVDPICRACMPGFAAALRTGGPEEVADAYLRILSLIGLLTLPAGFGISLISAPVVTLGFGQAWLDAIPVVAILGIAWTTTLFGNVSIALLSARTMLRTILVISAVSALLRLPFLLLLIPSHGLTGAAIAVGIVMAAEQCALMAFALHQLKLSFGALLARVARPLLASCAMTAALWASGLGWAAPPASAAEALWQIMGGMGLGVATFTVAMAMLWSLAGRPPGAEMDLLRFLRRLLSRLVADRQIATLRGG